MESTYQRNVIFKIENILLKFKICVPRLKCSNCGSTHAVLPSFCVPFKQYSKQAILEIVTETSESSTETLACKAYEAACSNDVWQADISNVMKIKVENKMQTVYLVQIIDDASRLIVGQTLTFNDNAIVFQEVLKKAIKVYSFNTCRTVFT